MLRKPHYVALGVIGLATLTMLNLPAHTTARLKLIIGSAFLPLFGIAASGQDLADRSGSALVSRSELLRQNEALTREVQALRLKTVQTDEIARENEHLRSAMRWQKQQPWKVRLANVVLRDPANWWRTVHIDLGSRDGMRTNLPVLTTEGLVGRVASVSLTRSQVVLVGDPKCKVSALVDNDTRDNGIIGASGPLESTLVEMSNLASSASLKPGQNVVTSGLGGVFPKGITIGKLVDFHRVEYGLFTVARVRLAANLSSLEEVWVLFP